MRTTTLSRRVERVQKLLNELYSKDSSWKKRGEWPAGHSGAVLHAPATEARIVRREKQQGWSYPPSYRQFLMLHNGWEHFWRDFTLVGVDGAHADAVATEVAEYAELQRDDWKSYGSVQAWENAEARHLYLPNHYVLGTSFSGVLLVWDARTRRGDGEMDAVEWNLEYGVRATFAPLRAFEGVLTWAEEGATFALQNIKAEKGKQENSASKAKKASANMARRKSNGR
jgi:hypothetical protein